MNLKKLFLPILALAALTGCKDEPVVVEAPVITFNQTEWEVENAGGQIAVGYSIANPVEGASIEVTTEATWIENFDTTVEGVIMFSVLENEVEEPREAVVSVAYTNLETPATFVVKQVAADPAPFLFENFQTGLRSYGADIYPLDQESPYIIFASTANYIEIMDLQTDEALFADDMDYFNSLAEYYGMTLLDLLPEIVYYGDQVGYYADQGVVPGARYVIYAYHVNLADATLASKIVRVPFTTERPEQIEADFEMYASVNGAFVLWDIQPQGYDGYYFCDVVSIEDFHNAFGENGNLEEYICEYTNELMAGYVDQGNAILDIQRALCLQGDMSFAVTSLKPEKEYAFFAIAIDEETCYAASAPTFEVIETEAVEPSDMVVDIEINGLTARTATIQYIPSTAQEPFAANCLPKEQFDSLGETDEEKLNAMKQMFAFTTVMGVQNYEFTTFNPETEYVAFAFGYNGGMLTTPIFTETFTTPSATEARVVLQLTNFDYYDCAAVAALDSRFAGFGGYTGSVFFPVDVSVEPASNRCYFQMFPLQGKEDFTNEEWISELLYAGVQNDFSRSSLFSYDTPYIFVGFACDENGTYGPLYKKEFLFTRDGVSDPQGYIDWFNNSSAPVRPAPLAAPVVIEANDWKFMTMRGSEHPEAITGKKKSILAF